MTGLSYTRSVVSRVSAVAGPARPGWTLARPGGGLISALDVAAGTTTTAVNGGLARGAVLVYVRFRRWPTSCLSGGNGEDSTLATVVLTTLRDGGKLVSTGCAGAAPYRGQLRAALPRNGRGSHVQLSPAETPIRYLEGRVRARGDNVADRVARMPEAPAPYIARDLGSDGPEIDGSRAEIGGTGTLTASLPLAAANRWRIPSGRTSNRVSAMTSAGSGYTATTPPRMSRVLPRERVRGRQAHRVRPREVRAGRARRAAAACP